MKLSKSASSLYDEITRLPVIDAHEHLPPESVYTGYGYSGVNLFSNYLRFDLQSAGMPAADMARVVCNRQTGFTGDGSVDSWWPLTLQRNFLWHDAASQLIQLDAKSA
ncbi:MAG: hypothetical protein HZA50_07690 [Planctomycetes bacterium]|nr:hypothetical protein [Planctomycetota bacterium]